MRNQRIRICLFSISLWLLLAPVTAMAEEVGVDIMVQGASSVVAMGHGDAQVQMQEGVLILTAGNEEAFFSYPVNKNVNLKNLPYLYFDIECNGGWDVQFYTSGAYQDMMPGFSSDYGPDFGLEGERLGELLPAGSYLPGDIPIYAIGAYNWINNLPANGVVTVKEIWIRVQAHRTLQLHRIFFGAENAAGTPSDDPDGANSPEATAGLGKDSDLVAGKAVKTEAADLDSQIVTAALWVIVGADLILLPGACLFSRLPRKTPRAPRKGS